MNEELNYKCVPQFSKFYYVLVFKLLVVLSHRESLLINETIISNFSYVEYF